MPSAVPLSLATCLITFCTTVLPAGAAEPLTLESTISLGKVTGRIDHLAVDLPRQRLFVAELGSDSVGIIDLHERKLIHTITGLKQPQGVGYHQPTDTLYVANAGDGSVRTFTGSDYSAADRIDLHNDADNIRLDHAGNRIFVGYGSGSLAVIDPARRSKLADIALAAHPEGFQLDQSGEHVFVNVPDAHAISVVDRKSGQVKSKWSISDARGNFPMAIDEASSQVLVVFRNPPKLRAFSIQSGTKTDELDVCGDSDDVFSDPKRKRLYVSCGAGFIDVVDAAGPYKRLARIATKPGARTSLFVPQLDRLFVAVRAGSDQMAAIWVYRPAE
jgi:YVTN family beta-propeller protein